MSSVLINPPASQFGASNAVLSARGVRRHASRFAGPLSIKGVMAGSAAWETAQGRYEVVPGSVLVINDGEEYEITVDALQPVETFCLFFERGFVEDALHAAASGTGALLDSNVAPPVSFAARLHFGAPLVTTLQQAHARMRNGEALEESFYAAALALVRAYCDLASRIGRLPALRASTRAELARRAAVATSFLEANLGRPVTVAEAAREACLSPFHFHRAFTALHGLTPHRYLTRLRLERARALLRTCDVTRDGGQAGLPVLHHRVAEVAAACGFESVGSFTTLFTRAFGMPPARFRRNREMA